MPCSFREVEAPPRRALTATNVTGHNEPTMATASMPDGPPERVGQVRPPDIYTVARHAKVSHQTVSRVLNNSSNVRAETRLRVQASIAALGYTPNAAARSLNTKRSDTLGLIVLNDDLHGPAQAVRQIERAAREAGYGLRVVHLAPIARGSLRGTVRALRDQMVDGVIVVDPHPEDGPLLEPVDRAFPLVMVGGEASGVPGVRYDSAAGVRQAVDYLLSLGHKTVHHVSGPPGWSEADARREAWRSALEDRGCTIPDPITGDWTAASGFAAGRELATRPEVTAVLAGNDHMALGLMRSLTEAGRRIPEDVSIIGFDNTADSAYYIPPLTTLSQAFAELGNHVVQLAVGQIQSGRRDGTADVVLEPPSLILRASTGRAPN